MWVGSADRCPARNEFVDEGTKTHALRIQIAFATNDQFIHRGRVATEGVIVSDNLGLNYRTYQPPDQCARRPYLTQSHLQSGRAMGHALSYAHLAPLPLAVDAKASNAILHLICERGIEQVLHRIFSLQIKR